MPAKLATRSAMTQKSWPVSRRRCRVESGAGVGVLESSVAIELRVQLHKDFLGYRTHEQHDESPKPGNINHILPALDGLVNISRHSLGRSNQQQLGPAIGHAGIDETWFHRDDADSAVVKPVAQALQIRRQAALGGAIKIIALTAAVAGHRRERAKESLPLLLKMLCQDVQRQGG